MNGKATPQKPDAPELFARWQASGTSLEVLVHTDATGTRHRVIGRLLHDDDTVFVGGSPLSLVFLPRAALEIATDCKVAVRDARTEVTIVFGTATLLIREYEPAVAG
jgi:hypothetical protein